MLKVYTVNGDVDYYSNDKYDGWRLDDDVNLVIHKNKKCIALYMNGYFTKLMEVEEDEK